MVDDPTGQLTYLYVVEHLHRLGDQLEEMTIQWGCGPPMHRIASDVEECSDETFR